MSILIKDMKMPTSCLSCPLQGGTADCRLTQKTYNWGLTERPSDCPLIEVSEDVQPVKHGKWIGRELGYCTCCGHHGCASDIWNGCGDIYYCPNCGAKMDG